MRVVLTLLDLKAMPDDEDYRVFGHVRRHPEEWSAETRAQMERQLLEQRRIVDDADPRDRQGRARLNSVVVEIESAIVAYDALDSG